MVGGCESVLGCDGSCGDLGDVGVHGDHGAAGGAHSDVERSGRGDGAGTDAADGVPGRQCCVRGRMRVCGDHAGVVDELLELGVAAGGVGVEDDESGLSGGVDDRDGCGGGQVQSVLGACL